VYDALYAEYVRLHDLFGRGADPALKTLKRLRFEALDAPNVAGTASRQRV
jgi:L-ribulokinase